MSSTLINILKFFLVRDSLVRERLHIPKFYMKDNFAALCICLLSVNPYMTFEQLEVVKPGEELLGIKES